MARRLPNLLATLEIRMKAVIALVLALALLAIGIPLSRAISDGEEHTITRTIDPDQSGAEQAKPAASKARPSNAVAARDAASEPQPQADR